jgi:SHS2 domain-containing protein
VPLVLLEHTADLGFTLEAPDLGRLFARGALAVHELTADAGSARPLLERTIAAEGPDLPSLFLGFLEEAHWLFEGEGLLLAEVDPARIERPGPEAPPGAPLRARAAARGEPFDRARHALRRPLKAITWHGLSVEESPAGARCRVVVDL